MDCFWFSKTINHTNCTDGKTNARNGTQLPAPFHKINNDNCSTSEYIHTSIAGKCISTGICNPPPSKKEVCEVSYFLSWETTKCLICWYLVPKCYLKAIYLWHYFKVIHLLIASICLLVLILNILPTIGVVRNFPQSPLKRSYPFKISSSGISLQLPVKHVAYLEYFACFVAYFGPNSFIGKPFIWWRFLDQIPLLWWYFSIFASIH